MKTLTLSNIRVDRIRINPITGTVGVDYTLLGDMDFQRDIVMTDKADELGIDYSKVEKYIRHYLKLKDIDDVEDINIETQVKPLVDAEIKKEKNVGKL